MEKEQDEENKPIREKRKTRKVRRRVINEEDKLKNDSQNEHIYLPAAETKSDGPDHSQSQPIGRAAASVTASHRHRAWLDASLLSVRIAGSECNEWGSRAGVDWAPVAGFVATGRMSPLFASCLLLLAVSHTVRTFVDVCLHTEDGRWTASIPEFDRSCYENSRIVGRSRCPGAFAMPELAVNRGLWVYPFTRLNHVLVAQ